MPISNLIKKNNAQLILTHPVTFNSNLYNLYTKKDQDRIKKFTKNLFVKNNIQIKCNPLLSHLDTKFAFDTRHHANKNGALIISKNLAHCVKRILNNDYNQISDDKAYNLTKLLEDKYHKIVENNMNLLLQENCLSKEEVSFKSKKLIFEGWSYLEDEFRWSLSNDAKIYFKIYPNNLKGNLKLNIDTLGKQNIKVNINGYYLGEKIVSGENKQIYFTFDPKILNKDKVNSIKFEFPNAHIASKRDKRVLAMALRSFIFE